MSLLKHCLVKPGSSVSLAKWDPDDTLGFKDKRVALAHLEKNRPHLESLQHLLSAQKRHALLIVLQGMDAAGKDGAIRHVMGGMNPQGCEVTSFKAPTPAEADHDYLWRVHNAVPARGVVGIFNRSHYEDVLVVRVHKLVPKTAWSRRFDEINAFEQYLSQNGVKILKFFLHLGKDEQKKRFEARLADPSRNWKASPADFAERQFWDAYTEAYEDALSRCSTAAAPWYIIPANKKWVRNLAVSEIIAETLTGLKLHYPPPSFDLSTAVIE